MIIKEKVYISGGISGKNWPDVKKQFKTAHALLVMFGATKIVNPTKHTIDLVETLETTPEIIWKEYMKVSIRNLVDCDAIYMLKDWEKSKGAQVEYYIARELGLKIYFDKDF